MLFEDHGEETPENRLGVIRVLACPLELFSKQLFPDLIRIVKI